MPGGVNSPVRAFKSVGGQPIIIDSVKGSHMWDIDGNEYIDYVGSWGPAIIGHADDEVNFFLNFSCLECGVENFYTPVQLCYLSDSFFFFFSTFITAFVRRFLLCYTRPDLYKYYY